LIFFFFFFFLETGVNINRKMFKHGIKNKVYVLSVFECRVLGKLFGNKVFFK
jgi:hypothetical protein